MIAGGLVATAYAPDAVVDSYLLRHGARFPYYAAFFQAARSISDELLAHAVPAPRHFNSSVPHAHTEYHVFGSVVLMSNVDPDVPATVMYDGVSFPLCNHSVLIVNATTLDVLFDTGAFQSGSTAPAAPGAGPWWAVSSTPWRVFDEDVGVATRNASQASPGEQLNFTNNDSDFMWYTTPFTVKGAAASNATVSVAAVGGVNTSFLYPYVDGVPLVATNADRTTFTTPTAIKGGVSHTLAVLSAAMGLRNTGVAPTDGKGLLSAQVNGRTLPGPWTMAWTLSGEAHHVYTAAGSPSVPWRAATAGDVANGTAMWVQATFDLPPGAPVPQPGAGQPNQTAYVLDLSGAWKGVAYVNGFLVGRYALLRGECKNPDCAYSNEAHGPCLLTYRHGACGAPTQHLYHVPAAVVQARGNLVTLFEEAAPFSPTHRRDFAGGVRFGAITAHPELD